MILDGYSTCKMFSEPDNSGLSCPVSLKESEGTTSDFWVLPGH